MAASVVRYSSLQNRFWDIPLCCHDSIQSYICSFVNLPCRLPDGSQSRQASDFFVWDKSSPATLRLQDGVGRRDTMKQAEPAEIGFIEAEPPLNWGLF